MAEELSGEHKLRIVLESILRNIPKEEQCQKYGISEDVFQEWHDHLITNGGKIFDPDFGKTRTRVRKVHQMSSLSKALLAFSLLANFAVLILVAVWKLYPFEDADSGLGINQTIPQVSPVDVASVEDEPSKTRDASLVTEEEANLPSQGHYVSPEPLIPPRSDLEHLLAKPLPLLRPKPLLPVPIPEPAREISFMGQNFQGKHVVYLLDVGTHVLAEKETKESFKAMKTEMLSSIANLSPHSYFNLVLFWNLREAHALGKTILRANHESKKLAIDWLSGLGETVDELKVKRSLYYPKELLYAKPLPGVVGLWYGLSTATSFDPDLVFVSAGNLPAFNLSEVPKSHYEGLGIDSARLSSNRTEGGAEEVSDLIKLTARKWLISVEDASRLPLTEDSIDDIALRRLGFLDGNFSAAQMIEIPWGKSFDHLISGMEIGIDRVPQTHIFVSLPPYATLPSSLIDPAREFSESSKGSFTLNPSFP
ncbi:MAG: hypothetical protein HN531_09590 [Opitutae bacterium]|jgi:hypothetical protein|nr:hypothetical protein [Opitutae bacterium]